jgi:ATP-dependent DNA helicase RecG
VLGERQAGTPGFRLARLEVHGGLLRLARAQAEVAVKRSERLAGEEFRGLRTLLYLFEREAAVRLLEAG